jgi:hypothetical protein
MIKRRLLWLVVVFLVLLNSGCAVLTKSQVKEVNKFATAANDYGEMPGAVIAGHAKIRKTRESLRAATMFNGDEALKAIQDGLTQEKNIADKGQEADAALKVLKDYAELLVKLTADEYTDSLQASSETLAKNIDKGIGKYNKIMSKDLSLFGSSVAAIVRGIGGMYIRCEQEKALKQAIISADPVIESMTRTVEEMMALYLDADQMRQLKLQSVKEGDAVLNPGGLLSNEINAVSKKYKDTAGRFEGKQPPSLPFAVADEIEAADIAAKLAGEALQAARSYRLAHAKLAVVVAKKEELRDIIVEVQTLAEEVKSAQDLKKKLDKK